MFQAVKERLTVCHGGENKSGEVWGAAVAKERGREREREACTAVQQSSTGEKKSPLILSCMNVGGLQAHFTMSSSSDITFKWPSIMQAAHCMSTLTLPHAELLPSRSREHHIKRQIQVT